MARSCDVPTTSVNAQVLAFLGRTRSVPLELFDLSFLLGKLAFELLNLLSSREIMADGSDKVSSLRDDPFIELGESRQVGRDTGFAVSLVIGPSSGDVPDIRRSPRSFRSPRLGAPGPVGFHRQDISSWFNVQGTAASMDRIQGLLWIFTSSGECFVRGVR